MYYYFQLCNFIYTSVLLAFYSKTVDVTNYINQLERADGARGFFDNNKLRGGAAALEMLVSTLLL